MIEGGGWEKICKEGGGNRQKERLRLLLDSLYINSNLWGIISSRVMAA